MQKNIVSELQQIRLKFKPTLPSILKNSPTSIVPKFGNPTQSVSDQETIKKLFPKTYGMPEIIFTKGKNPNIKKKVIKVGVVLSGGQAPGGHNVIAGLFDALKKINPPSSP
ncbi:MAG: hypothetical protein SNJ64_03190 [Endomicrobiia bacterium]